LIVGSFSDLELMHVTTTGDTGAGGLLWQSSTALPDALHGLTLTAPLLPKTGRLPATIMARLTRSSRTVL